MAEQKVLQLTISRVDGPVFEGDVAFAVVPGISGEMTLLPHHAPLISPLKAGTIRYKVEGSDTAEELVIDSGTLELSDNHATILI